METEVIPESIDQVVTEKVVVVDDITISDTEPIIATEAPKKKALKLYFSLVSGEIYTIEEDETKTVDEFQVPLKQRPNTSCKKCFGRLHMGRNITFDNYIICPRCARKCIDFSKTDSKSLIE